MKSSDIYKLKLELLMNGIHLEKDLLETTNFSYKENNYGYNNPNKSDDISFLKMMPTDLILDSTTIVSFRYNANSRFVINKLNDDLMLFDEDSPLCLVEFSKRPQFWNLYCRSGIPMKRIGSVYGCSTLTFFIMNYCQFFDKGLECKFCSLAPTYQKIQSVELKKNFPDIIDVIKASTSEGYEYIDFIGGSLIDSDREFSLYIELVKKICKELNCKEIKGYVVSQPPRDFTLLYQLKEAGISGVKFNLEVTNPELFAEICPGKSLYGYDQIEKALEEAVVIFGKNNVYTNIVLGLEPLSDVIIKAEKLAQKNIGVVPHVYHRDDDSNIASIDFTVDDLYHTFIELNKINKKYGIKPWLEAYSSRGNISWDLYKRGGEKE